MAPLGVRGGPPTSWELVFWHALRPQHRSPLPDSCAFARTVEGYDETRAGQVLGDNTTHCFVRYRTVRYVPTRNNNLSTLDDQGLIPAAVSDCKLIVNPIART